jgi:hypothetical protein
MDLSRRWGFLVLILLVTTVVQATSPTSKFDEFGDLKCEDEHARLDNFAIQLLSMPTARGYIIFHGGRLFRGRLPKRGEAAARAARMKPYLVNHRRVPNNQVIVIDGGYAEDWYTELWIVPAGVSPPAPYSTIPASDIRFGKGKVNKRAFRCPILG